MVRDDACWTTALLTTALAAGLALAAGCSGPADGNAGRVTTGQSIKGGMVDNQTDAIVGIWSKHADGKKGLCTGTLIAPNLVLTARHCVEEVDAAPGTPCSQASFGTDYVSFRVTTDTRMNGQSTYYHDAEVYRPSGDAFCGRDIAMIRLKQSIPASEAKPITPRLKSKVTVGQAYAAIGFGRDGSNGNTGIRRRLDNRSVQCIGKPCGPSRITSDEFIGDGPACHGDSGGGALAPDRTVFGVTSRAGKNCTWTMFSSVYQWRQFIQNGAADAAKDGGYAAPVWANTGPDGDGDGYADGWDNCPAVANKPQADADGDGSGDACDDDRDGDGIANADDFCPDLATGKNVDTDGDGKGDGCDEDDDNDGHKDSRDNCPKVPNPDQTISDADGSGDACDNSDGDALMDDEDNCPLKANRKQIDSDGDGIGDVCDETPHPDADGDGVADGEDNCPMTANPDQTDADGDGSGDACDPTPRPDTGTPDTGMADAGMADSGMADGGEPDAGSGGDSGDLPPIVLADKSDEGGCSAVGSSSPEPPWAQALLWLGLLGVGLWRRRA